MCNAMHVFLSVTRWPSTKLPMFTRVMWFCLAHAVFVVQCSYICTEFCVMIDRTKRKFVLIRELGVLSVLYRDWAWGVMRVLEFILSTLCMLFWNPSVLISCTPSKLLYFDGFALHVHLWKIGRGLLETCMYHKCSMVMMYCTWKTSACQEWQPFHMPRCPASATYMTDLSTSHLTLYCLYLSHHIWWFDLSHPWELSKLWLVKSQCTYQIC